MEIGVIQESESTITMKDEDGSNIVFTLLKTPINLDELTIEYEGEIKKEFAHKRGPNHKRKLTKKVEHQKVSNDFTLTQKLANNVDKHVKETNYNTIFLKEPISLDNINWGDGDEEKTITFNVKTVQGTRKVIKIERKVKEFAWKPNALTIFQHSYVYPFIHTNNQFKCTVCSIKYLESNSLKDHMINGHNLDQLKAALFNNTRENHLKVDVTNLTCKICSETLTNLQTLKVHLKNHGKDIDLDCQDNIIPFRLGDKNFDCQLCNKTFLKLRPLIIHMSTHFNNFSCEICGAVFISLKLLKSHHQTHESGSFPCDRCNKVFTTSAKRSLHIRGVHLKKFQRRCPICPEKFNSDYQRTKHLRIVHNQTTGLYKCETCSREYDLRNHLLVHIRSVHLQERNHHCPICYSRFFSKYSLSRHMVIHSGDKNFKCRFCGKAYARRSNLREHLRSHDVRDVEGSGDFV